jgi:hypothetical protein
MTILKLMDYTLTSAACLYGAYLSLSIVSATALTHL